MRPLSTLALVVLLTACERSPHERPRAAGEAPQGAPSAPRRFGAPPAIAGEPVDVAVVLADPSRYLDQTIKCAGQVARVCEKAGCWLELRATSGAQGLRVPMAGHAFFVPPDLVGKRVVVEGRLGARALSEAELAHLQGEGLKATEPLYLAAVSVVVP